VLIRESFDPSLRCGFCLEGAHGQADCTNCPTPNTEPDKTGRTFGLFAGFLRTVTGEALLSLALEGLRDSITEDCAKGHLSHRSDTFEVTQLVSGDSSQAASYLATFQSPSDVLATPLLTSRLDSNSLEVTRTCSVHPVTRLQYPGPLQIPRTHLLEMRRHNMRGLSHLAACGTVRSIGKPE
jgi:hypothetical protein